MNDNTAMTDSTMLGTYTLDGPVPVEPEIVLNNCQDTALLGQLVSVFSGNPDIRFFLVQDADTLDMNADFHFLRDGGNWVLANNDTLVDVLFDDASFNPSGTEGTFSLVQDVNGSYLIDTGIADAAAIPPSDQLLVDLADDGLFVNDEHVHAHTDTDAEPFFIDPSVLQHGESEIVVSNFHIGSDVLELPDGMSIKDVIVDNDHDFTELVIGQNDTGHDDIVVKLLGISQPDLPMQDYGMNSEHATDDLINHIIHSGLNMD
ncbi:hypothetical protein [Pseudodesulfovibrio sediminis]|uniref:Uncharacterized protein n=1 Tax=Pseudodesulfovibrio sediminis TaxID=2810563 RepID=A0ABM7P527_9BACT|nr:hypothetical protein [Pseudodesulfovibrio sediminis]BCS87996.1 hypothetical protein PSDVSF_12380 [Pseudodesulfovibrio sediminis]